MQTLQKLLKQDLMFLIKNQTDCYKKVIGLMKDELGGKIMREFAALGVKTYSYLTYNNNRDKKAKGTKNVP